MSLRLNTSSAARKFTPPLASPTNHDGGSDDVSDKPTGRGLRHKVVEETELLPSSSGYKRASLISLGQIRARRTEVEEFSEDSSQSAGVMPSGTLSTLMGGIEERLELKQIRGEVS